MAGVKLAATVVILACLSLSGTALAHDEDRLDSKDYRECTDNLTGIGEAACANEELDRQDAVLNATYKSLMARTTSEARRSELRDAEREWIRRRDHKCNHAGDDFAGGSQQPAMIAICNVSETEARIIYLRSLGGR
jgi:uncharacterized protein YecT (DUF1311 family)